MAIWRASFTIRDEKNRTRQTGIYLDVPDDYTPSDPSDPVEYVREYARALNAIITGAIVNISLEILVDLPNDIRTSPLSNSDVEEGVAIVWETNTTTVSQRVPTFDETLVIPGTDAILESDSDWLYFVAMMTNPIDLPADWSVHPTDSRGVDIIALRSARERFKK